ncbi:MAG TPA: hypothetical protein VGN56_00705 [Candidatus Paceibacterota bacterium]|jgi:hypothetical protein|nr:hypothetical protein [Candidatus Paceibacterota bacterium]
MYLYSPNARLLKDSPEHIDLHIRTGDYFSFLATMMGFLEEALGKCDSDLLTQKERAMARELRHDLRYVQANYEIRARELGDVQTIRSGGNLIENG